MSAPDPAGPRPQPDGSRRLDTLVAARLGLTRSQVRGLILAGKVRVDDVPATKPGAHVPQGASVEVAEPPRFVSRGGDKLAGALDDFGLAVAGLEVLDVGASTGGFTDALLQRARATSPRSTSGAARSPGSCAASRA